MKSTEILIELEGGSMLWIDLSKIAVIDFGRTSDGLPLARIFRDGTNDESQLILTGSAINQLKAILKTRVGLAE